MTTISNYKQKILDEIKILNENPSKEHLDRVESMIDFYSDVYKDEFGYRPSSDIGGFRRTYSPEVMRMFEKMF